MTSLSKPTTASNGLDSRRKEPCFGGYPQETLEQLAARLPRVRTGQNIKVLEFGEFRFPNGNSLLAYIGGIHKSKHVSASILFSQTTAFVRGNYVLGWIPYRFAESDVLDTGDGRIQINEDARNEDLTIDQQQMAKRPVYTRIGTM